MKLSVLLHTSSYRGDHAADVMVAHEIKPGETVQELAERLLTDGSPVVDHIEIRKVQELPNDDS